MPSRRTTPVRPRRRRFEAIVQLRHHAETAAAAADRPAQILVRLRIRTHDPAVRRDDLRAEHVIDRHSVPAMQESDAARERDAADPDRRRVAEARRQIVRCRHRRVLARRQSRARTRDASLRGDVQVTQRPRVEHDSAIPHAMRGTLVNWTARPASYPASPAASTSPDTASRSRAASPSFIAFSPPCITRPPFRSVPICVRRKLTSYADVPGRGPSRSVRARASGY